MHENMKDGQSINMEVKENVDDGIFIFYFNYFMDDN